VSRVRSALVAVVVGCAVAVGGHLVAGSGAAASPADAVGPGTVTIRVDIRYSRFDLSATRVRPGTLVRFVVHNHDPINHELVVGGPRVHERHAHGTEARHPPVPGEVSVGPGATGVTVHRFSRPSRVVYACHLPAHLEYGMVGELLVVR
jgi:uncharacterized cupredoxin-like copper-binding protein